MLDIDIVTYCMHEGHDCGIYTLRGTKAACKGGQKQDLMGWHCGGCCKTTYIAEMATTILLCEWALSGAGKVCLSESSADA